MPDMPSAHPVTLGLVTSDFHEGADSARRGRATLKDVARRAGVSVPTVSRVIAGNYPVALGTKRRVEKALRELDYVANTHARALRGHGAGTVAFVLNHARGEAFAQFAHGIEEEASRRGRLCLLCVSGGDPVRELQALHLMRQQGAEVVIVIGSVVDDEAYRRRMAEIARSLDQAGSRLVLCGRPPLGEGVPVTVVEYDNEGGAYAVTSRLLAAGHRRVLLFGGDVALTTSAQRFAGYRRALTDYGVPYEKDLVVKAAFDRGDAYLRMRERLAAARDFTGVFALTDVVAAGALRALTEAGLQVPGDVSLVGYDDVPPATDLSPQLTTVHVPYEEMGRTAVRLALDHRGGGRVAGEGHVLLGTHVVVRDSVAPPPPAGTA
jgi:LacI family transcriptional regulator, galactose operon repressor